MGITGMRVLDRRQFAAAALGGAVGLLSMRPRPAHAAPTATDPEWRLPVPALAEPGGTGKVPLVMAPGRHRFRPDAAPARTAGISSDFLAPVVRLPLGRATVMAVTNQLDEPTTLHWHGVLIPSELDGGPHNPIAPGATWQPELTLRQPPSTAWFHPHIHGETARQVYSGLAGMMILADGGDRDRGLPDKYGVDDIPLIIQDRRLGAGAGGVYAPDIMDLAHGFRGETLAINGRAGAWLPVPRGIVRLRLLNAANAQNVRLGFASGRTLHVIASDGGYLSEPVAVATLTIAPGERYEALVDCAALDRDVLQASPEEGPTTTVLTLVGRDGIDPAVKRLPDRLGGPGPAVADAGLRRRSFVFDEKTAANMPLLMKGGMAMDGMSTDGMAGGGMAGGGMAAMHHEARSAAEAGPTVLPSGSGLVMAIAGEPFAMDRIDASIRLGSTEIWTIRANEMPHPFHVHGAQFRVLSKDGGSPPAVESGWKDTVLVTREAELLVRFDQTASRDKPFMFHCHVLEHEDLGMMGQYVTA